MLPDECWPKRKYEWNWKVEGCLVRCWKRQTLRCWWIPAGPSLPTLHPAPLPSHWPLARAAPGPPPDSVATASIGSPSLCGCPTGAAGCAFGSSNSVLQEGWFETLLWSILPCREKALNQMEIPSISQPPGTSPPTCWCSEAVSPLLSEGKSSAAFASPCFLETSTCRLLPASPSPSLSLCRPLFLSPQAFSQL